MAAALDRLMPDAAHGLGLSVSGGSDSTALLALAADWAAARGRRVDAVTVDHRLRPESADEATAAGRLAERLGVPHTTLCWEERPSGNLQAEARAARHRLIGIWAAERGLQAVALGHTLDDQAETVLMRLSRGAGIDGLAGMAEDVSISGVRWIRPLLGLRRAALRDLLRARGIGWADDPTNDDVSYDRVVARKALATLAPLGLTAEGLSETAARLRLQREALDDGWCWLAREAICREPGGWARLDPSTIAEATGARPEPAVRLLGWLLAEIGGGDHRPERPALARLWAALASTGFGGATLGGCVLEPADGQINVIREPSRVTPPVPLRLGAVWDGRWRVDAAEGWEDGTTLGALGEAGLAALREAERAGGWQPPTVWQAMPLRAKHSAPALWLGGALLCAPLAGYRTDRGHLALEQLRRAPR